MKYTAAYSHKKAILIVFPGKMDFSGFKRKLLGGIKTAGMDALSWFEQLK